MKDKDLRDAIHNHQRNFPVPKPENGTDFQTQQIFNKIQAIPFTKNERPSFFLNLQKPIVLFSCLLILVFGISRHSNFKQDLQLSINDFETIQDDLNVLEENEMLFAMEDTDLLVFDDLIELLDEV